MYFFIFVSESKNKEKILHEYYSSKLNSVVFLS